MSRVLGVDYGTKRVGLAISDEGRKIASPLAVLRRHAPDEAQRLQRLIQEEQISLIVVGLPIRTTGHEGQKAREARQYGAWLHRVTGLPVVFWDERFTTAEAEQLLLHAGLTKKQRQERLDKVAAQRLLQTYLDAGCPPQGRVEPLEDP
ncbi:MAG: Holliday junction resolvase RuvX [Gemmatales bacterium]|nr:Holliday junction resolvase RuvX [Gemmatales bacterium]MDW8388239.1 Holliday junction resolvase RuvX [Gemmatales bacterium]